MTNASNCASFPPYGTRGTFGNIGTFATINRAINAINVNNAIKVRWHYWQKSASRSHPQGSSEALDM
jgi:hypothetical protein